MLGRYIKFQPENKIEPRGSEIQTHINPSREKSHPQQTYRTLSSSVHQYTFLVIMELAPPRTPPTTKHQPLHSPPSHIGEAAGHRIRLALCQTEKNSRLWRRMGLPFTFDTFAFEHLDLACRPSLRPMFSTCREMAHLSWRGPSTDSGDGSNGLSWS